MKGIMPSIIIPDTRDTISRYRRWPEHCIYCKSRATSREHALVESQGGRLWAKILCESHQAAIATAADEPMILQFQPVMHMLAAARQRGRKGSTFRGTTDAGQTRTVTADGRVREPLLRDVQRNEAGKIVRADGDLAALDALMESGAFANGTRLLLTKLEKSPPLNFNIAVAADVERGVLKAAFHFVAGFVADAPASVTSALLPFIIGEKVAGGIYVRTLPLQGRFFPSSWPPMHQIATYPDGDVTYVTVLLFGLHGFQIKLPFATPASLRYVQRLTDGDMRPLLEENDHVRDFTWDDRLTADDWEALRANLAWRSRLIDGMRVYREVRHQCRAAAKRTPSAMVSFRISYAEAYRTELQIETFTADQISLLAHLGAIAAQRGRAPWNFTLDEFAGCFF